MMKGRHAYLLTPASFILCIGLALLYAVPAYALSYYNGTGIVTCPADQGFSFIVVTCIQTAIIATTMIFLDAVSSALYETIIAFIIFVVCIFGIQMMMGVSELTKKAPALLLKIGAVLLFADNFGGFAPNVFEIMEEAQLVVTNAVVVGDMVCDVGVAAAGLFTNDAIWLRLDCIIMRLFGFGGNMIFYNGVLALLSAAAFSGAVGVMVFFAGISALWSIMSYAFYAVYIFLISYLFAGFLIVISPLLLPLLLLGVTTNAYNKWLFSLISAIVQPTLVFAFMAITLPLIDQVVFVDPESITAVLGDDFTDYYRNKQLACSQKVGTEDEAYKNINQLGDNFITGARGNLLAPMFSGATDLCALFQSHRLDFLEKHAEKMMDVMDSMIKLLFVAYLVAKLMKQTAAIGAFIVGGGFSLSSAASGGFLFDSAMRGGINSARSSMAGAVGGKASASEFTSRGVPAAMSGFSSGFSKGFGG